MSIHFRHDIFLLFQCKDYYCEGKITKDQPNHLSDLKKYHISIYCLCIRNIPHKLQDLNKTRYIKITYYM